MAKLKTPLRIDGKRISTIEELRENFVLDEVLESYKNGVLQKWLASRGFDEAEKVEKINFKNNNNILRELIKIFEAEYDEKEINESLKTFAYMEHREERKNEYRESNEKLSDLVNRNIELNGSIFSNNMINNYFLEYKTLVDEMISSNEDGEKIIKIFKKILKHYNGIFAMDYKRVFSNCKENRKNVALVMLMNKELRNFISYSPYNYYNSTYEDKVKKVFSNQVKNLADMLNSGREVKLKNTYMVISNYVDYRWSDIECFKILEKNETIKFKDYSNPEPFWAIEIDEEIYNTPLSLTPINTVAQKPQTTTQLQTTTQSFREKLLALSNATSNAINATSNAINAANNAVMKKYK